MAQTTSLSSGVQGGPTGDLLKIRSGSCAAAGHVRAARLNAEAVSSAIRVIVPLRLPTECRDCSGVVRWPLQLARGTPYLYSAAKPKNRSILAVEPRVSLTVLLNE